MSTAEPIVRVVKRYVCPWCHRGHGKRDACIGHMETCFANPDRRACKTCRHLISGGDPFRDSPPACSAGMAPFVADCPSWQGWRTEPPVCAEGS